MTDSFVAHELLEKGTAELPLGVFRHLVQHSPIRDLGDDTVRHAHTRWQESSPGPDGLSPFEAAKFYAPDADVDLSWALRQLMALDPSAASYTFGMIAHTAQREYGITPLFTAGYLAENASRKLSGTARALPQVELHTADIDTLAQASTTPEALRGLGRFLPLFHPVVRV
ncbi:hypothetical protein [Streptomyces yaizuensis]|uniref:Uncharacterized protein n=1 Tax=Streptomyces yaizuensis TaxID=2989713 RepID=A0ABQ5NXU8_9ACTN|nr:hypothetical protein [Streptomyces sp. YSPA8]GLF95194.1 hypothetical protein SYYSPA8_12875 [Streptomyces sp. YSPA8]